MKDTGYELNFHNEITKDLNGAYNWYEEQEAGLGARFETQVRAKFEQIKAAPETYEEKSRRGFREVSVKDFPYSIVYKVMVKSRIIFISAIHHHKLHPKNKFRK